MNFDFAVVNRRRREEESSRWLATKVEHTMEVGRHSRTHDGNDSSSLLLLLKTAFFRMKHTSLLGYLLPAVLMCWSTFPVAAEIPSTSGMTDVEILAFTEKLEEFRPASAVKGTIRCHGSGMAMVTMVSLSQSLRSIQADLITDVTPPPESGGFAALEAGTTDLLALPYIPTAETLTATAASGDKVLNPERDLVIVPYALNPVAIYVNRQNPIAHVSMDQLKGMLGRHQSTATRRETWGSLGVAGPLAESAISLVLSGRDYNQARTFRKKMLQVDEIRLDARTTTTPAAALCEVGADASAFCIASILYATPATRIVPLLTTDGTLIPPTIATAQNGTYPFTVTLSLVAMRTAVEKNPALRELMRYAISRRAQRELVELGIFPITVETQKQAEEKLQ
jgi:phosphate transport system substrate-binding protein